MRMRLFTMVLLTAVMLSLVGCASSGSAVREPRLVPKTVAASTQAINREERSETRQSYVGIYDFGGDDWTGSWDPQVPPPPTVRMRETNNDEAGRTTVQTDTVQIRQMRGYRVQLANVTTEQEARRIEQRAKSLFDSVYVVFQTPSFKIRGGNFKQRAEADAAAGEARRMGFRGAWVVPDRIEIRIGGPAAASSVSGNQPAGR